MLLTGLIMQDTIIGNYKIIEEIGRGGMGIVYRAEQVSLGREVAIKTLPLEMAHDEEYLQRIENEAQIMAKFSNPNIVHIHDRFMQDDAIYLVMEYVPGITVTDHLRDHGPYDLQEAARIIIRVAVALEHAHSKGIIHRDIKPSNIMIRKNNVVKVTDFGIAKSSDGSDITRMRFNPGTQNYMSPEQARGIKQIDGRSDIYALGVVFYQMLTGKIPPYPVPDRLTFVPQQYESIILKCLAEDPAERYQSAKDLVNDLDDAKAEKATQRKKKPAGRPPFKKKPLMVGAAFVLALIVLVLWQFDNFFSQFDDKPEILPIEESQQDVATLDDRTDEATEHEAVKVPEASKTGTIENETFETEPTDTIPATEEIVEADVPGMPALRPAMERIQEMVAKIDANRALGLQSDPREIFSLTTGVFDALGGDPDLTFSLETLLDQTGIVKRVTEGGCDLLITLDSSMRQVVLSSNLFGNDNIETYQEIFGYQDDPQLFTMLAAAVSKYYCFNAIGALEDTMQMDNTLDATVTLNGAPGDLIQIGSTVDICMQSGGDVYAMLLSVNAEGVFMLYPQIREEHQLRAYKKPLCTGPMAVSPPTGTEMIAAIMYDDRMLFPVEGYLASEDQVIIEAASWSYSPSSPNRAIDYCDSLFNSIQNSLGARYSADAKFFRTHD